MKDKRKRRGSINPTWLGFLFVIGCLAGLTALLMFWSRREVTTGPLESADGDQRQEISEPLIYCAAGLKGPMDAVVQNYKEKYGVSFNPQYGGSQTLLANIEISCRGDLYIPGDESFLDLAQAKGLLAETIPLASMKPVLAVAQGNPKKITSLADLLRPEVRFSQANPDATAVGKLVRQALRKSGHWEALANRAIVSQLTVNDVATSIRVGTVDAGFVFDATVHQVPGLEVVPLPQLEGLSARVSAGVLKNCTRPTAALRFARYLAARDRGLIEFQRQGFEPVAGDTWSETPELRLLSGAMLRPAIQDTIKDFEEREGVHVKVNFNGCGILVAQMKAGEHPDAYFSCDKSFMNQVSDLFIDEIDVSMNRLVILVQKDNPKGIRTLKDLAQPGLRVGLGHPQQGAMGLLTQRTLVKAGCRDQVMKNVVVQTPTGDMLVNQLRTGSLDAAVVYVSNAAGVTRDTDSILIEVPTALAVQPLAVGKESTQKYLTGRLVKAILSRTSRERFEALGFKWQVDPGRK
jgi:molybdenum ABC transporter molybdate-binding protein